MMKPILLAAALFALAACETTPVADVCAGRLGTNVEAALAETERRLGLGCEYQFESYFRENLATAEANPSSDNKRLFSDHLVRANELGVISKRQARELYNRYFNVKFVSLAGDYNTCSQTCPVQARVLNDMKSELQDKELGLLRVSTDRASYYRADSLLKETQIVLEATCRACDAGNPGR
ncbi:MAG: hypothetical protein AAF515_19855 [Pseudomonadota bacterium]